MAINYENKKFLEELLLKADVAGSDYYFKMEKEVFVQAMEGDEDEDFYKEYLKQREVGFEVYQNQVKEEFNQILSSEELHFFASEYNYDGGNFLLEQVILHHLCDIETAKLIYWFLSPTYIYEKYGSLENCSKEDYICYDDSRLLMKMEEKVKNKEFKTGLQVEKNECVIEMIEETDFSVEPFVNVPEDLRKI